MTSPHIANRSKSKLKQKLIENFEHMKSIQAAAKAAGRRYTAAEMQRLKALLDENEALWAQYVGVGTTLFDEMVKDGRMPAPKRINGKTIWDRVQLDEAFMALPCEADDNPWDVVA